VGVAGLGVINTFDGNTGLAQVGVVRDLYAEVYAEPPYCEGPADVADFVDGWPRRCAQPGFRLVVASSDSDPIGFAFGHELPEGTGWWSGLLDAAPPDVVAEWPGRTFAVIELAVRAGRRRQGVARGLHEALLCGLTVERATLLCRPEAEAAESAYAAWGYRRIGALRPFPDAPTYDAMLLPLR
jgi:GNAT superfamily N-acetyltransferase